MQVLGSVAILVFGALLLSVRIVTKFHGVWRDAIVFAALYIFTAAVIRIMAHEGNLTQDESRVISGFVVIIFIASLGASILEEVLDHQRRKCNEE